MTNTKKPKTSATGGKRTTRAFKGKGPPESARNEETRIVNIEPAKQIVGAERCRPIVEKNRLTFMDDLGYEVFTFCQNYQYPFSHAYKPTTIMAPADTSTNLIVGLKLYAKFSCPVTANGWKGNAIWTRVCRVREGVDPILSGPIPVNERQTPIRGDGMWTLLNRFDYGCMHDGGYQPNISDGQQELFQIFPDTPSAIGPERTLELRLVFTVLRPLTKPKRITLQSVGTTHWMEDDDEEDSVARKTGLLLEEPSPPPTPVILAAQLLARAGSKSNFTIGTVSQKHLAYALSCADLCMSVTQSDSMLAQSLISKAYELGSVEPTDAKRRESNNRSLPKRSTNSDLIRVYRPSIPVPPRPKQAHSKTEVEQPAQDRRPSFRGNGSHSSPPADTTKTEEPESNKSTDEASISYPVTHYFGNDMTLQQHVDSLDDEALLLTHKLCVNLSRATQSKVDKMLDRGTATSHPLLNLFDYNPTTAPSLLINSYDHSLPVEMRLPSTRAKHPLLSDEANMYIGPGLADRSNCQTILEVDRVVVNSSGRKERITHHLCVDVNGNVFSTRHPYL